MTVPPVTLTAAPDNGVWRLGWADDPIMYNQLEPETFDGSSAGRFSLFSYGMLYCASAPAGCYAEALAPFRLSDKVRELMAGAPSGPGQMALRDIASSWRDRRILVRLVPRYEALFLDVETEETRAELARDLRGELRAFGVEGPLTDEHIRGKDRRITRQIAAWAVAQRNEAGHQLVQGITYRSSYGGRRCWAILRDTELKEVEWRPIQVEDPALREVALEYGLTIR
ncbi:RES domain-containing protein [Streptomyces sp. NPDC007905]|uniref:RES domain-containing protein n=1 Tax=Streptomyces sp. NPDC007905 TaxID=3364788 RepID=UPI0036ECADFE